MTQASGSRAPRRALVVDDTEGNRYAVARLLRRAGIDVTEADSGATAFARLGEATFDLLVLDVNLPDTNGHEILRRVRSDPANASLPVMHVSASFTSPTDQAYGLEHGADAYLTHPLEPEVFIATVRSLLRAEGERERRVANADQAREAAEGAAARATLLQTLTAALARTMSAADVGQVVLTRAFEALQASAGVLAIARADDDLVVLSTEGASPALFAFGASHAGPLAAVMRSTQTLALPTREAIDAHTPPDERAMLDTLPVPTRALHAEPLVVDRGPDARVLGAMLFVWPRERLATSEERTLITAVADQCALALERARLYDAERAARAVAEEASLAKTQLLSMLSHELRTPLNAIRGNLDLIDAGVYGALSDQLREALGRAHRSAVYLTSLINDLLNFARLESGQLDYEIRDVPLDGPNGLLREITALTTTHASQKGVLFTAEETLRVGGATPLVVRADADKVRMILANLVTNAIKFTPAGGTVTLVAEPDAATRAVHVHVRDTGRGIPPHDIERIFEPFVQVDRDATQASQRGVGLGLAIARTLARAMDGELHATSEVGHGSTFTLTLPSA